MILQRSQAQIDMSIFSILVLSLFLGLIVGAGVDKSQILPIALVSAVILFVNRNKIGTSDTTLQADYNLQQGIASSKNYYTWQESGQFTFKVTSKSFQGAIQQLLQKNTVFSDVNSIPKEHILQAYLIPDNDHPYNNNAIRIDIDNHTVGYLSLDEALNFRARLEKKGLSNQITLCRAIITEGAEMNDKTPSYNVWLDIDALE